MCTVKISRERIEDMLCKNPAEEASVVKTNSHFWAEVWHEEQISCQFWLRVMVTVTQIKFARIFSCLNSIVVFFSLNLFYTSNVTLQTVKQKKTTLNDINIYLRFPTSMQKCWHDLWTYVAKSCKSRTKTCKSRENIYVNQEYKTCKAIKRIL